MLPGGGKRKNRVSNAMNVKNEFEKIVRGALCAECKMPLSQTDKGCVIYFEDTTKRTTHYYCRTLEDDPKRDN